MYLLQKLKIIVLLNRTSVMIQLICFVNEELDAKVTWVTGAYYGLKINLSSL